MNKSKEQTAIQRFWVRTTVLMDSNGTVINEIENNAIDAFSNVNSAAVCDARSCACGL